MGLSSRRNWAQFRSQYGRAHRDGQNPLLSDLVPGSYVGSDPDQQIKPRESGDRGVLVRPELTSVGSLELRGLDQIWK